ncbi:NAD-dependent formate dehydrogenase delta subunit [Pusillimonas sp. T7-7]|uniref:formate dehydrogenase subunit delta n=1 Tax=Pusillimonas sp. (strain T7-7) TaxID=1007105 RepID=UPI0002084F44|nr:formate dehydrogenase subunit delta [Pusillimonas sp. T7-7]AEC20643.1 NAD-dependent formate dehydrogenase delta subunit [Pusillimonas sp. T7-7]
MNNIEHLIKLANRIGDFFEALPDREEGLAGIANHIQKFWEPRMRIALLSFLEQQPDGQTSTIALSDIALQAITQNKEQLTPKTSTSP